MTNVAFIGLGRMGILQSRLARFFGCRIVAGIDVNEEARAFYAREFGVPVFGNACVSAVADADIVWLTVTDGQIAAAADSLRGLLHPECVVLHTSGALPSRVVSDALANPAASLHPLASCPPVDLPDAECVRRYAGVFHVIEGDAAAARMAADWVEKYGGRIVRIDVSKKALYHAAAVFASNYPTTLCDITQRLFVDCGFDGADAREAACSLMESALRQLRDKSPSEALTGPVKRRDPGTIAMHRDALAAFGDPSVADVYNIMMLATARMTGWDPE